MPAPYAVNSATAGEANALLVEANAEIVALKADKVALTAQLGDAQLSADKMHKPQIGNQIRVS